MHLLTFLARRFVAGETAADAVAAAERMNQRGITCILDFLGEDVATEAEAQEAVEEYLRLLEAIESRQAKASVSLKASQMGLLVSPETCLKNLSVIAERAAKSERMVWLDMEGSALTQKTIDVFDELRARHSNVGLCLQAYLVRTGSDVERLMRKPLKLRLCKGAYKEPPSIAYTTKAAVDGSYRMLAQKVLQGVPRGVYPAFATHDRVLIQEIVELARRQNISQNQFEFEMLYGIENVALEALSRRGFKTQVYIPYGRRWLPYFMRRLRERKENIYFVLRNIVRL